MCDQDIPLPKIGDHEFQAWMQRQYDKLNKKIHRWKCCLDQPHAVYEYQQARRWKAVLNAAAAYETQEAAYRVRISKVSAMLAGAMDRHEITPAMYQNVIDLLEGGNENV